MAHRCRYEWVVGIEIDKDFALNTLGKHLTEEDKKWLNKINKKHDDGEIKVKINMRIDT